VVFYIVSFLGVINVAEQDPKQEGEKFFTETSKSQMQSLIATGAATVAILTTLSMGRSDAQQVLLFFSTICHATISSSVKEYAATESSCHGRQWHHSRSVLK